MNVRFEYLYRDAGNFKRWGEIVFSNAHNIEQDALAAISAAALPLDGIYFLPDQVGVPKLHFEERIEDLDHDWHEIHTFNFCNEPPNDPHARDIQTFIQSLFHCTTIDLQNERGY